MSVRDVGGALLDVLNFVLCFAVLAIIVSMLGGCAADNEIRVTEYGGSGSYMLQATGQAAGCRAIQKGAVAGCLKFDGETCSFRSVGCK